MLPADLFRVLRYKLNLIGSCQFTDLGVPVLLCRVTSLKQKVVAVAAANKHTAILTDGGAIFS